MLIRLSKNDNKIVWEYSTHQQDEKFIKNVVLKSEVYKYFGKISGRWEDNIKMGVIKIRYDDVDCIHVANVTAR
jgi:hypothetical protein